MSAASHTGGVVELKSVMPDGMSSRCSTLPWKKSGPLRQWRVRRRLSQLELAIGAGTTQRHVSFLEQGRSTPGRDIVSRLAESLDLTLRKHNTLRSTAGFAPLHPESAPGAPVLAPVLEALQHVLDGHLPYPAMVMDGFGELVASNGAFSLLLDGVAPWLLKQPINVLRVALHPDGMAQSRRSSAATTYSAKARSYLSIWEPHSWQRSACCAHRTRMGPACRRRCLAHVPD